MKRIVLIVAVCLLAGCGRNYSNGSRTGVVTKLSEKGVVCKSWEGEMLMTVPGALQPEKFIFNVDAASVEKVKAAMASGNRVELVYRQWLVSPPTIDSDYVIVDVKDAK